MATIKATQIGSVIRNAIVFNFKNSPEKLMNAQLQLDPLFDELALHLSSTDIVAIREIVREIQQRIARFDRGFSNGQ